MFVFKKIFENMTRPGGWPGSRPGFRVLIGSPGRSGQFFFLNQNDVVLVKQKKNKSQRVCNRILPGQAAGSVRSHRVFSSPVFSSTRPGFSLGSWVDPSGLAEFQNYDDSDCFLKYILLENISK